MKKTKKFLSIAALALLGAAISSCSSNSDFEETPAQPQPASGNNVVTLTTTVGLNDGETRALSSDGTKTFSVGEYMAVVYENTSGEMVKAVSEALESSDIAEGSKSATFTVTLTDPKADGALKYIYPATMATGSGEINYSALNNQNGTLNNISQYYDLGYYEGTFDGSNLPSATLDNKLAILAMTLKNDAGGSDITNSITNLTLSDGTYSYNINPQEEGRIYVAIRPTASATIEVTATDETTNTTYAKALSNKTYAASNGYNVTWRMAEVISGKFSVSSTKQVYFSKGNLRATGTVVESTTTWTWAFAEHQWDKIGGKDQTGAGTPTGNNKIIDNGKLSDSGTVDLFGWSTDATYLGINNSTNNSTYSGAFADWGSNEDVIAGIGSGWYTLSRVEWDYLLNPNATKHRSGMQYIKAQVNGANGLIVFPDDWSDSYHHLNSEYVNNNAISFENIKIDESTWVSDFEAHGAVFLPVAGQRHVNNNYVEYPNGRGHYWSSTSAGDGTAYRVYFTGSSSEWSYGVGSSRRFGYAVRLVRNVK